MSTSVFFEEKARGLMPLYKELAEACNDYMYQNLMPFCIQRVLQNLST